MYTVKLLKKNSNVKLANCKTIKDHFLSLSLYNSKFLYNNINIDTFNCVEHYVHHKINRF